MDTNTETRKDAQDCTTKDAPSHRPNEEKIRNKKRCIEQKGREIEKYAGEESRDMTDKETEEGSDQNSNKDQDSDVSFQEDAEEEIDATENEEDRIEYIKRSTKEAEEHLEKHKIPCWSEIHRRTNWRMARRVFDWHPGLDNSIRTRRQVGRPKKRWEDGFHEFLKTDETQGKTKYDLMNHNSWMIDEQFVKIW